MEEFGPWAGLCAAACWSVASVLYVRVPLSANALTTIKNTLAAACMLLVLAVTANVRGTPMFQASASSWWYVCLSGVIGLGIADIAYFRSIQILGARLGLTLTLLTPPATALLGQLWLGEILTPLTWGFIFVTLIGVGIVMTQRSQRNADQDRNPGSTRWGVCCALVGIVTMAIGSVVLKRGLDEVGPLEATFIRLLSACIFGIVVSAIRKDFGEIRVLFRNRKGTRDLLVATMLGTVIGVLLMLVAYKYCPTGVAATLTSTTPLFVIPVVWRVYGEKVAPLAVVGAGVAFAGVCGLLLS